MSGDKKKQAVKPDSRMRSKSSDRANHSTPVETIKMLPSSLLKSSGTKHGSASSCDSHFDEERDILPGFIVRHDDMDGLRPVAIEEELQGRVYELSALLNQWQKRAKQYKHQVTSLTSQLKDTKDKSEALIYAAKHEHDGLIQELKTTLTNTTSAKLKLEQEYNGLQISFKKSLEQNKKDMETLHTRWKKRSSDLEKLRSDNKEMRHELATLSEQIKLIRKENERLFTENEQLKIQIEHESTVKTENNELRKQNYTLRQSVEDLTDNKTKGKPDSPKQCSCMGPEYRILFELTLLKLQALERQQCIPKENPYIVRDFNDNDKALMNSAMGLARVGYNDVAQGLNMDATDSTDSCDSPRSPPLSAKHVFKNGINPEKKPNPKALSERPLSLQNFSELLFFQPNNERKLKSNGHVNKVIEADFRQRAFSDSAKGHKRFPLNKSYTTEDPRIAHAHLNTLNTQNMSGGSNPDVFSNSTSKLNGSRIPVEICSDDERPKQRANSSGGEPTHSANTTNADKTSGFGGLRSRRNGITDMPLDVSVALRMHDVKKSKDFSHLLKQFTKDKPDHKADHRNKTDHRDKSDHKHKTDQRDKADHKHKTDHEHGEKKFPGIRVRKLSRKKSKAN